MATLQTRILLGRIGNSNIFRFAEDATPFAFEAGMQIDADGAYKAYHPDGNSGLDFLGNGGHPGNWFGVVTDTGANSGDPIVQGPNDPAPGFFVSATSLQDRSKPRTSPLRYVDASSVPFIVLPSAGRFGAVLGDVCLVYNPSNEKSCAGIYADGGPAGKIGEASIAMADAVGVPSSPRSGGQGHGLVYVVFPGSSIGWPVGNAIVQQTVDALFANWGGLDRLKQLLPDTFQV